MGIVFEAEDLSRNERVAVMALQRCDGATLRRFKNEFRSFADLVHPNLVALYELLESHGSWFLVMELLHGKNFWAAIRGEESAPVPTPGDTTATVSERTVTVTRWGLASGEPAPAAPAPAKSIEEPRPLTDLGPVRRAFVQLATAIDTIHRSGNVHRDIKPSNVHVEPDGRVVLLDFGVATALQLALKGPAEADAVVGTPPYMSPELLRGGAPSRASDWYAFGVMMNDIITGRRAFRGPVQQQMRNKLDDVRPRLDDLQKAMPEAMARLVDRLLAFEPEQRPGFAEILEVLEERPGPASRATAVSSELVGRVAELEQILAVARESKRAPRGLTVRGRSGVGKSALLKEALEELERTGAIVLGGRCYENESVRYKSIDPIVDGLAELLARRPELKRTLKPAGAGELARAFPVLRDAWGSPEAPAPSSDWATSQRAVHNALVDTLQLLARQTHLVCFVDDLQWGDADSGAVLAALTEAQGAPMMVLVSFREEDADTAAVRAYERAAQHQTPAPAQLRVQPLSDDDCATLASRIAAQAGVSDPTIIAWARAESGGEPYFLHELLFFASGQSSEGRTVKGLTLQDVLQQRAERLSASALLLLRAVALSVSGVPVPIAAAASGVASTRRVLAELRAAHLVRTFTDARGESIDTFHDKVREIVSAVCGLSEAQALHLAMYSAWRAIDAKDARRVFAMAHHGMLAGFGIPAHELRDTCLEAASVAEETYNPAQVRRMLLKVRELSTERSPFAPELALRLGRACLSLGDVEEARRSFESVIASSQRKELRADARYGLVRVKLSQLDTAGSLTAVNEALVELEQRPVVGTVFAVVAAVVQWAWAWLRHRLFGSRSEERARDTLIANLYRSATQSSYFLLSPRLFLQGVLLAYPAVLRLGVGREASYWYSTVSMIAAVLGRTRLRQTIDDLAVAAGKASSDPQDRALAESTCCIALDLEGEPVKAAERMVATLELGRWLDNSDCFTLIAGGMWNVVMRGHPRKALSLLKRALQRADETGGEGLLSQGHTFRCYGGPIYAMLGEPDVGARYLATYQEFLKANAVKDTWRNVQLLSHRALFAQLCGSSDDVLEDLFAQHAALGRKPSSYALQLRHFFIAKAQRRLEQAMRPHAGPAQLERLTDALDSLRRISVRHPTLRAHWRVVDGGAAWLRGESPDARWNEALELAAKFEQPWVAVETELLKLARAKRDGAATEADAAAARVRSLISEHGLNGFTPRLEAALR